MSNQPTLPDRPDEALSDDALDARIQATVENFQGSDPVDLRTLIRWKIETYYGLDEKYGFDDAAESRNVSNWPGLEGFRDLEKRNRIHQLYLAKYMGDSAPKNPFNPANLKSPVEGFFDSFFGGIKADVVKGAKSLSSSGNFVLDNLIPIVGALVLIMLLPKILESLKIAKELK